MKFGGKIIFAVALATMAACKPVPGDVQELDVDAAERGKALAAEVECGACHVLPGIDWPQGSLGPSLTNYDQGALIAGVLPKQPDNLAAFIRNAPAYRPGGLMPAMALTDRQARDIAHYLLLEGGI